MLLHNSNILLRMLNINIHTYVMKILKLLIYANKNTLGLQKVQGKSEVAVI